MRRFANKYVIFVAVVSIGAGCCIFDDTKVDQSNNVSIESYRACIVKGQKNLVENLIPSLQAMKTDDLASPSPQHNAKWWDQKIGLLMDTATLNSDTLAGSNVKPATAPVNK